MVESSNNKIEKMKQKTEEYENTLQTLTKLPSNLIYHYTSTDGLLSILKNKSLWFSNIFYLNDSSEFLYTYTMLEDIIDKLIQKKRIKNDSDFIRCIKIICRNKIENKSCVMNDNIGFVLNTYSYVASFSLFDDNLTMWNYYSKDKNNVGYNIGFNIEGLKKIKVQKDSRYIFEIQDARDKQFSGCVIYDINKQRRMLKKMLLDYYGFDKKYGKDYFSFTFPLFFNLVDSYAHFIKHPAFEIEKEYRIVIKKTKIKADGMEFGFDENVNTRTSNGLLIDYIERNFVMESVVSIGISPSQKQDAAKDSLLNFLSFHKYENINIKKSDIPLRY